MNSDIKFVQEIRNQFPFFNNTEGWFLFENAGGSQTLQSVIDRIVDYLSNGNVQLRAHNELSDNCMSKVLEGVRAAGLLVNAQNPETEICLGPSATQLLLNLSLAVEPLLKPHHEIIVTDCDHESNIGCWRRIAEKNNVTLKEWRVNPTTYELDLSALEGLLTPNTKVVAFTHCSNVLGTINPIKEYIQLVRRKSPKALVVVDGVAYAAHRTVDVQELDVDFYVFSLYKTYGPHIGLMYAKHAEFEKLSNINHFYIGNEMPRKMQPGNFPYELAFSLRGIVDYLIHIAKVFGKASPRLEERELISLAFQQITKQESRLTERFMNFLSSKPDLITVIGNTSADSDVRVPTISFVVKDIDSKAICEYMSERKIAVKYGDCYTRRMMDHLGLLDEENPLGGKGNGVVRVSMVHYNSLEEVDYLIKNFDEAFAILSGETQLS